MQMRGHLRGTRGPRVQESVSNAVSSAPETVKSSHSLRWLCSSTPAVLWICSRNLCCMELQSLSSAFLKAPIPWQLCFHYNIRVWSYSTISFFKKF